MSKNIEKDTENIVEKNKNNQESVLEGLDKIKDKIPTTKTEGNTQSSKLYKHALF